MMRASSTVRLLAVPAFAVLMAACAQATVPMVPVPITLQTFAVLLAGAVLGARAGALAVLLYLTLAAVGLPVLSDGASGLARFAGPTAGYLFAFPPTAALVGALAGRGVFRGFAAEVGLMIAAHALILVLGAAWLARDVGLPAAIENGVTPFLIGAAVKSLAVVVVARLLRRPPAVRRG